MERLDYVALRHISQFLDPEDIIRLGRTCKRIHSLMPRIEVWRGKNFSVHAGVRCAAELYFDGPTLSHKVQKLTLSVIWNDQGWGNRKGELFLKLMRPNASGEPAEIALYRRLFGIAEHFITSERTVIQNHPVVRQARPGDFYRFMRYVGGGGGHSLTVKDFRVVATL